MDKILMMQNTVKEIYPDYLEYCKESSQFINPVLTVAFQFPIDIWKKYKNAYLNWLEKGQENEIVEFYMGLRSALGIA